MLGEITIGQFIPKKSAIHSIDPRMKLILTVLIIAVIFAAGNFEGLLISSAFVLFIIALTGIPIGQYIKGLKAVFFIIIFTSALNIFYAESGTVWLQVGSFTVYDSGVYKSIFIVLRIIDLIFLSSALTFTTSPTSLTDALERVMKPLKLFKIPVNDIALMMTIALRFIPTLLEETDKIMNAQKARGADFESGGLFARVKAMIPILVPLFVSCITRAYELATAMEARCYNGGKGKTRMKLLHLALGDWVAVGLVCVVGTGVVLCGIFF